MPLIKVKTSVSTSTPNKIEVESLLKTLSASLAKHLGKPESYVMTAFESDVPMTFAGTTDPVCYLEIKSVGTMDAYKTKAMSQDFCQKISEKDRMQIKKLPLFQNESPLLSLHINFLLLPQHLTTKI